MSDDRARRRDRGRRGRRSIAYHLTRMGWSDVLLLDRSELTSGSTFHSAGLVGQLRSSVGLTRMMMYGVELYRQLAEDRHRPLVARGGLAAPGLIEGADRGTPATCGVGADVRPAPRIVSTDEARDLWPLFDPTGIEGAAYLPTDGYLDPTESDDGPR